MIKTTCSKCGNLNDRLPQKYCRLCHAENMRKTRPKHSQLSDDQHKRANCRAYANVYLKRGKIERQLCQVCGKDAQMHHDDYDKPLDIKWFCREHHLKWHVEHSN